VGSCGMEWDLVTGALSYSGSRIAGLLLASGRRVRTLTAHPDRPHPLRGRIEVLPYRFDDADALARSLEGVSTLYNTYWVRFERGPTTFAGAVANSRALFEAARRSGVRRIVHVSIANAAGESPLPYFRGKAIVEQALMASGVEHDIVRPTWLFGGGRDILVNNIAWMLRRLPIFALPGNGDYRVQPVHVDDLARICLEAARGRSGAIRDAAGPDTLSFRDLVAAVGEAVDRRPTVLRVPPGVMTTLAKVFGLLLHDVVLTADEIRGLMAGFLVSHHPALGRTSFLEWLRDFGPTLGRTYLGELERHFRTSEVSRGR
jgi:uncharacterized protein YbjT (DUF2867 family)